jgi:hypothetical protein
MRQIATQHQEQVEAIQKKHSEFTLQLTECHSQQVQLLRQESEEVLASKLAQWKTQMKNNQRVTHALTAQLVLCQTEKLQVM